MKIDSSNPRRVTFTIETGNVYGPILVQGSMENGQVSVLAGDYRLLTWDIAKAEAVTIIETGRYWEEAGNPYDAITRKELAGWVKDFLNKWIAEKLLAFAY